MNYSLADVLRLRKMEDEGNLDTDEREFLDEVDPDRVIETFINA